MAVLSHRIVHRFKVKQLYFGGVCPFKFATQFNLDLPAFIQIFNFAHLKFSVIIKGAHFHRPSEPLQVLSSCFTLPHFTRDKGKVSTVGFVTASNWPIWSPSFTHGLIQVQILQVWALVVLRYIHLWEKDLSRNWFKHAIKKYFMASSIYFSFYFK